MRKPIGTKAGGQCLANPDTCHLPAPPPPTGPGGVPTPYPNMGMPSSADKVSAKVKIDKKKVLKADSEIPSSKGDEAGCSNLPTPKGLMSQKNMGKIVFKAHSSKVKIEGKGAIKHAATTAHNGSGNYNAPMGKFLTPSQGPVRGA